MPTIIDSLIVQIGLDPANFKRGQKEVDAGFQKTKTDAVSAAGEIEKAGKKATDAQQKAGKSASEASAKVAKEIDKNTKEMTGSLGKATSGILELTAAFLGGQGLKEFVKDSVRANNSLGNLSDSLGSSPALISAWGAAAQRMGGSASATMSSIQGQKPASSAVFASK
jgi:hypothetical protein